MNESPPITIERLQQPSAGDREALMALDRACFAHPWTDETFDRMMATPVSQVFVARDTGGRIVAFCACWVIADEVHINTLAVDARVRRHGIASALLSTLLRLTRAARATLEVRRSNVAALALYEKLGFQVTATRSKYYADPEEDGLILWRQSMSLDGPNP